VKIVDLHPEDLLDKDARGELADAERERLEAHLERCDTCRFERQLRADFAAEEDDDLVEENIDEIEAPPVSPRRVRRARFRVGMLVAAALLVGGVAGAGVGIKTWTRLFTGGEDPTVSGRTQETPRDTTSARVVVTSAPAPTPTELELSPPIDEPETAPIVPVYVAPPVTMTPPVRMVTTPPVETAKPASPGALFDAAADARRRGDHVRALELHRELVLRFPSSREARVSYATVGQLHLDRGDAVSALASFDAYRAGGAGPLDEPVMVGRATALERLGRVEEARKAWSALLQAFPGSPYAQHARARLDSTPP
jgi:TolA-binding protein